MPDLNVVIRDAAEVLLPISHAILRVAAARLQTSVPVAGLAATTLLALHRALHLLVPPLIQRACPQGRKLPGSTTFPAISL